MPSPSPKQCPQGSADNFAECLSCRLRVPMEALHQQLRQFYREHNFGLHRRHRGLEPPRLFYVAMCLAVRDIRRRAEPAGCLDSRKPISQPPESKIEPLGMFRSRGTRHMSQAYYRIRHLSRPISFPLDLHSPVEFEVIFCVRGVISPLLANLFLHYGFDVWMRSKYPQLPFERYADDAIVHCRTEAEAQEVRAAIAARMEECRLELHPVKTKIVYCKDEDRRRRYPNEKFDFLGYGFQPRRSKNRFGKYFINFSPAISDKAGKSIRVEIRSWNLHLRSDKAIEDLSRMFNPIIRGWLQYYGRFYRSALYPPMRRLDRSLARWADRKYKKLRRHLRRATHWVARISRRDPKLWAHWQVGVRRGSMAGAV